MIFGPVLVAALDLSQFEGFFYFLLLAGFLP